MLQPFVVRYNALGNFVLMYKLTVLIALERVMYSLYQNAVDLQAAAQGAVEEMSVYRATRMALQRPRRRERPLAGLCKLVESCRFPPVVSMQWQLQPHGKYRLKLQANSVFRVRANSFPVGLPCQRSCYFILSCFFQKLAWNSVCSVF